MPSVVAPGDLDTLADDVRALGAEAEADLESALVSFGRGVTLLRGDPGAAAGAVARFAGDEERALEGELGRAKRALDEIEMKVAMSDFWARPANALARLLGLAQQQAT